MVPILIGNSSKIDPERDRDVTLRTGSIYCPFGGVHSSPPGKRSVRCRTDCERETGQSTIRFRKALHEHPACASQSWLAVEIGPAADDVSGRPREKLHRPATGKPNYGKVYSMLYTIAVVLLILWLLGLVTSYTLGGFIHVLLVVAVIVILINLITGRRAL
jgi:hypothetical protein